jgi:hypothetical protein
MRCPSSTRSDHDSDLQRLQRGTTDVTFQSGDTVRIIRLIEPERDVTSAFDIPSQPHVGQIATVIDDVGDGIYLVERTTDDGASAWLAEFEGSELELVDRAPLE